MSASTWTTVTAALSMPRTQSSGCLLRGKLGKTLFWHGMRLSHYCYELGKTREYCYELGKTRETRDTCYD